MIDIGKNNIFLLGDNYHYPLTQVFKYFDLQQVTYIYIGKDKSLYSLLQCKSFQYSGSRDLHKILKENSFRLDIIIVECSSEHKYILDKIREVSQLPVIMLTEREITNSSLYDFYYKFYRDSVWNPPLDMNEYYKINDESSYIEDIKSNWVSTIRDIRLEKTRDYKLNKILNK